MLSRAAILLVALFGGAAANAGAAAEHEAPIAARPTPTVGRAGWATSIQAWLSPRTSRPPLSGATAQAVNRGPPSREYQIKAAFLYNFAKFVEWPAEAFAQGDDTFVLGVVGEDPFGVALESINGRNVSGRRVVIKRFQGVDDLEYCHVLFISSSEENELESILASIGDSRVLTVGEMDPFIESGGIIKFIVRNNKVRFQINEKAAQRAGLEIALQLLRLAQ